MNTNFKHAIPVLAAIVLSASTALAQMPAPGQGPRGAGRTPPTAEQLAQRQAQRCADIAARGAAQFAYMEERLKLTAQQKPLFDRWKAAVQTERAPAQANCTAQRPAPQANAQPQRATLPERNARLEQALKDRLASLQKIRPAQEALYNALTAEQKQLFETRRGGPRMAAGPRMGGRDGMARPGGRGFGGPGGPGPRGRI